MTQTQITTNLELIGIPGKTRVFIHQGSAYEIIEVSVRRAAFPIMARKMLGGTPRMFQTDTILSALKV